jgi:hypothetical protein
MSIQALRYQYPNGLKTSFLESQQMTGVLIKPAILILKILLELIKIGKQPRITLNQCQNYLLPIIRNEDWPLALNKILENPEPSTEINRHARRNIQDWFKFLSVTSIFELVQMHHNSYITLSEQSFNNIFIIEAIASYGEQIEDFWIPFENNTGTHLSWFSHFGHIPTEYFTLLEEDLSQDYINRNYFDAPDESDELIVNKVRTISLAEIPIGGKAAINAVSYFQEEQKINSGYIKRIEKTKLHDEMVNKLSNYFVSKGYSTYDDKQSVDLVVKSGRNDVSIFEVKTATLRNIYSRSRLAVGQVLEYSYRYKQDYGLTPQKNIVFNIDMEKQGWLKNYVNNHLDIGLVSVLGEDLKFFNLK